VNYFRAGENPLLHTWTLGVEFQLALLFPLLVLLFAKWGASRAGDAIAAERRLIIVRAVMVGIGAVAAVSFTLAVMINDAAPMWAYFGPHTRLWSFCAGALMAFITGGGQSLLGESKQRLALAQCIALGLLLVPALLYDRTLEYPGVMALAPVGGTLLLLAGGDRAASSWPGRLLGSPPLVAIGRVSFAWYLWHAPLMVLGGVLSPAIGVAGKLAWGAVALGAALLTHRLLERPAARSLITRAASGRPLLAAAAVSAALAFVSLSVAHSNARYVRQSVHSRYLDARNDDMGHDCWKRSIHRVEYENCAFGDSAAARSATIALVGDSHASHWLGGLDIAGREYGWRIDVNVMGACPVADLRGLVKGAAARLFRECARFQEQTMRRLAAERPRAVLLSNADHYMDQRFDRMGVTGLPDAVWIEGLRRTYARLDRMGIEVIVLRGLPWVPFDVPSCLSRHAEGLPLAADCRFTPDHAFMARAHRAQDAAARGLRVRFIDMNDLVCGTGPARCATERDGLILFTDDNHITRGFSRSLAPALGGRLVAALDR
jgi:hypothetical protein